MQEILDTMSELIEERTRQAERQARADAIEDALAVLAGVRDYYAETVKLTTAAQAAERCRAAVEKLKP